MFEFPAVYKLVDKKTKRAYIGSSRNPKRRISCHKTLLRKGRHFNPWLQRVWDTRGENGLEFKIILYCRVEDLVFYEQLLIDNTKKIFNTARSATPGPKKGRTVWTEERKKKHSELMRGNTHLRGYKVTEETRRKMSASAPKTKNISEQRRKALSSHLSELNRKLNKNKPQNQPGRKLSEEHKEKLRGKVSRNPEHQANLRAAIIRENIRRGEQRRLEKEQLK